jgi:hypothetical protein
MALPVALEALEAMTRMALLAMTAMAPAVVTTTTERRDDARQFSRWVVGSMFLQRLKNQVVIFVPKREAQNSSVNSFQTLRVDARL